MVDPLTLSDAPPETDPPPLPVSSDSSAVAAALAGDDFEGVFEFLVVEFSGDGVLAEVSRRVVLADAFNAEDRVAVLVSLDGLLERADVLGVAGSACNVELDFGAGLEVRNDGLEALFFVDEVNGLDLLLRQVQSRVLSRSFLVAAIFIRKDREREGVNIDATHAEVQVHDDFVFAEESFGVFVINFRLDSSFGSAVLISF